MKTNMIHPATRETPAEHSEPNDTQRAEARLLAIAKTLKLRTVGTAPDGRDAVHDAIINSLTLDECKSIACNLLDTFGDFEPDHAKIGEIICAAILRGIEPGEDAIQAQLALMAETEGDA